jgi:hypothetical protein
MITLEYAIQKSTTRPFRSVHHTSFLWVLSQELVRSTTHRLVAVTGAGLPFSEILALSPRAASFWRVVQSIRTGTERVSANYSSR